MNNNKAGIITKLTLCSLITAFLSGCSLFGPKEDDTLPPYIPDEGEKEDEGQGEEGEGGGGEGGDNPPVVVTPLASPSVSLNGNTVSWNSVEHATSYTYYINEGEYQSTTNTSVTLNNGETFTVCADSSDEHYSVSDWSNPISYVNLEGEKSSVKVVFRDTDLQAVSVFEGTPYNAPSNVTKEDHTFGGWYVDPFFKETFEDGTCLHSDTVLHAKWIPFDYIKDTYFWVKASDGITNPRAVTETGWKLIPLEYSGLKTENGKKYTMFGVDVEVSKASTYVITNTTVHGDNSQYWHNYDGGDFTLNTAGYYHITFSVEYAWMHGDIEVHAHADSLSENPFRVLKSDIYRSEVSKLQTPVVNVDKEKDMAIWATVEGATSYEYIIDNDKVISTTANSVNLYQGSFISVRAISEDLTKNSKWSMPYAYDYIEHPSKDYSYIYFYDSGMKSFKISNNTKVTKPGTDPVKFGFKFEGWYKELSYKNLFDFNENICKNTVIYPKWTRIDETVFYHLIDQDNNKLGDLLYYTGETTFNEYKCKFETTKANTTVKVVDPSDHSIVYVTKTLKDIDHYTMYYSKEKLWDAGTDHAIHAYFKVTEITYYFTRPISNNWINNPYAYMWQSSNDKNRNADWPGKGMIYVKTNSYDQEIYKYSFGESKPYDRIIFNNNASANNVDSRQTVTIDITGKPSGTQWWTTGEKDSNGKNLVGEGVFK